jgi:3-isopropylmalate dehydrogenase
VAGLDILIVRELTGGIYFGEPRGIRTLAERRAQGFNTDVYSESEIRRIGRVAFEAGAQARHIALCSVDKANVLEVTVLWREVMEQLAAEFPDVELSHMYVDNAAMQLVRAPKQFDVIVDRQSVRRHPVGCGRDADRLDRHAAVGLAGCQRQGDVRTGAWFGARYRRPNLANPLATILSLAMLMRYSLDLPQVADASRPPSPACSIAVAPPTSPCRDAEGCSRAGMPLNTKDMPPLFRRWRMRSSGC